MSKRALLTMLVAALLACDERDDRAPDDPGAPVDDLAVAGATDESGSTADTGETGADEAAESVGAMDDDALAPVPLVEDEVRWALDDAETERATLTPRTR